MATTPQCYFASPCFCTTCIQKLPLKFCYKRSKVFEETQSNLPQYLGLCGVLVLILSQMDSDEDEPVYVPTPFVLSGAPPSRRLDIPQTVTWEKCLCHCDEDEQGQLTEFAERSWQSFLKAAAIRRDATWSFLKANNIDLEGDSQPRGRYYRRCYSIYIRTRKHLRHAY